MSHLTSYLLSFPLWKRTKSKGFKKDFFLQINCSSFAFLPPPFDLVHYQCSLLELHTTIRPSAEVIMTSIWSYINLPFTTQINFFFSWCPNSDVYRPGRASSIVICVSYLLTSFGSAGCCVQPASGFLFTSNLGTQATPARLYVCIPTKRRLQTKHKDQAKNIHTVLSNEYPFPAESIFIIVFFHKYLMFTVTQSKRFSFNESDSNGREWENELTLHTATTDSCPE